MKHQIVTLWNGCMCIFYCDDNFVIQMMFSMNVLNTKVVDNFLILLFLKFHDFRPVGLGVIDFIACPLNRSEWLNCLAYLNMVNMCKTLGVWLPQNCISFINMCIIYLIMPLYWNMYMQHSQLCSFHTWLLVNGSSATCDCNMSFSYLETWQHGSNMTSLKLQPSHETCETWNCNIRVKLSVLLLHHMWYLEVGVALV